MAIDRPTPDVSPPPSPPGELAMPARSALLALVVAAVTGPAHAVQVAPEELATARRWAEAKFRGKADNSETIAGYVVLANNDPVQRNARGGKPMSLVGKPYTRGLYCHAASRVVVRLPGRARSFHAVVGVDSNEQTSGGRGSVVFEVLAGGKSLYRSPLMREGMQGLPVELDLNGSRELTLAVGDGGDGIGCDQSDWAEARVTLDDGRDVWLGELPEIDAKRAFSTTPPFAFTYDGQPSAGLLEAWPLTRKSTNLGDHRTRHELVWTAPDGLEARCDGVVYDDYPTVEWTLQFRNTGKTVSKRLADVRSLDETVMRGAGEFILHSYDGSTCVATDYRPHDEPLGPGKSKRFAPVAGRSCDPWLPYFNVEWAGEGLIVAVGWPGQWSASFARDKDRSLHIRAGQETTDAVLDPGESLRMPLMALQFYQGDAVRAQNIWRRWMLAHNVPRPGGKLPPTHIAACSSHQFGEMIHADEASQVLFIDRYLAEGIKLDYWWMDAGWYKNRGDWPDVGTWEVDPKRFPRGLRAITDHAHAKGVKSIVWFEPERVSGGTWISSTHPEWVLGGKDGGLLNLGNDAARAWLTDHVDGLLKSQGIDLYRQDFNIDPLPFWKRADTDNRWGLTENRHVAGYLAYWDELKKRHPDMLIDSCASGGRRNDLETLRRAVPLLRSDYILEPVGQQLHHYGIASWMPFHGTGVNSGNAYEFRSQMGPHLTACYDVRKSDLPYDQIRRLYRQWLEIKDLFLTDYYPLTAYDSSENAWMGWQYDAPAQGRGMVQMFRRSQSPFELGRFVLRGLDPKASYVVRNLDAPVETVRTGKELVESGLPVAIPERRGAVVITYRKK
jgi:alpha-galactosidase